MRRPHAPALLLALAAPLALGACGNANPLRVQRSACPAVAVLEYAGDVTTFSPGDQPQRRRH